MAISFKSDKEYGYSLLPLFGISNDLVLSAKKAGITVEQNNPGTFLIVYLGVTYGSVSVKGTAISLAKSKTLGPASKEALKFQFEGGIKKALAAASSVTVTPHVVASPDDHLAAGSGWKAPEVNKPDPWAATFAPKFPKNQPVAKFSKDSPVNLEEATNLYQPVNGTTSGSVYFVLARFQGMNVAGRVQGSKLSLRAEGYALHTYKDALEDLGMEMKGGYSSAHYEVAGSGLMYKTLGALIGRVGFHNAKDLPDLNKFIGGQ